MDGQTNLPVFQYTKNQDRYDESSPQELKIAAITGVLRGLDPENTRTEHGGLLKVSKSRIDHPHFTHKWFIFLRDIGGSAIIWNLVTRVRHLSASS